MWLVQAVPFAGEVLEGHIRRYGCHPPPIGLLGRGVFAFAKQLLLSCAGLARFLKADVWVWPDREELLLASDLIPEAPDLAPCRRDGEVETSAVGQLVGLFGRLGFADLHVCERHSAASPFTRFPEAALSRQCERKVGVILYSTLSEPAGQSEIRVGPSA